MLACTDSSTDIGKVIVEGGFGWWCESNDAQQFKRLIKEISLADISSKSDNALKCLKNRYTSEYSYNCIFDTFEENQ